MVERKKIRRRINFKLHFVVLVLTILLFSIGMFFGMFIDKMLNSEINQEINKMAMERIQTVEFLTLLEDSSKYCSFFQEQLNKFDQEAFEIGKQLEFLENEKGVKDLETKANYSLLEIRNYLLEKKINKLCGKKTVPILYFYSDDCQTCEMQGRELTALRKESNEKIRVYSFDTSIGSTLISELQKNFRVKEFPTIIINEEKKLEGFHSKEELEKELE